MKQWQKSSTVLLLFSFLGILCSGSDLPDSRTFSFSYKVKITNIPTGAEDLQLFIPAPVSDYAQNISDLQVHSAYDVTWKKDPEFGNQYLTLHLEKSQVPRNLDLSMEFQVKREKIHQQSQYPQTAESHQKHLRPDSLIPLSPAIQKEAEKAMSASASQENIPQRFYNHVLNSMKYDKSGKGWGRGDALYACNAKAGNCTDFHSLFMGMCRTQEIPVRFHIGFPIPSGKNQGKIGGYHCWASFLDNEKGWIPVDISNAWKSKDKTDFYFGGLGPNRVRFTTGRDIPIEMANGKVKRLNYFIYPEVWIDGQKHQKVKTTFKFAKASGGE